MASKDNYKIPSLLDYVETYEKPHRIMRAFNDTQTVEQMRKPILDMFHRMDMIKGVL